MALIDRIPYVRTASLTLLAIAFVVYSVWLYRDGGKSARLGCANAENAALKAQRAETEKWQQQAMEMEQARDEALRKLRRYKPKVVQVVRANPSGCSIPKPVADELREQVRKTNEAVSAAGGAAGH